MQSVEAELRLSYPRKTFSALNLKIISETWGRHESSGDEVEGACAPTFFALTHSQDIF